MASRRSFFHRNGLLALADQPLIFNTHVGLVTLVADQIVVL